MAMSSVWLAEYVSSVDEQGSVMWIASMSPVAPAVFQGTGQGLYHRRD